MATKILISLIISCVLFLFGLAQTKTNRSGKEIFTSTCSKCHGQDGTKGKWGAKNLQASRLSDDELIRIISEGKNIMPSWRKRLSAYELNQVAAYVKTLRK